jgi:hypothetical protein
MQRTVKEYLWGYSDPILRALKKAVPQFVPNDQVSVFGSAVILNKSLFSISHIFHYRLMKPNMKHI